MCFFSLWFRRFIFFCYCWLALPSLIRIHLSFVCSRWNVWAVRFILTYQLFFVYFHGTCHLNISISSRYTHAISIVSSNVNLFKLIVTFIKFSLFFTVHKGKKIIVFRVHFNISSVSTELSQIELSKSSVNVVLVTSRQ